MSLSAEDDRRARELLSTVDLSGLDSGQADTTEVKTDYITDILLLPGATEKLASLMPGKFALLYGKSDARAVSVGAISFSWNVGPSLHDIQLAIQAANDVLYTRGRHDLELVGLYIPRLQVEQLEPYLDVGLGLQVVMGGQVRIGREREVYFEPRAISRSVSGEHFLVNSIRPIQ